MYAVYYIDYAVHSILELVDYMTIGSGIRVLSLKALR